jgi:transcription initiation factor TFIIB
MPSEGERCTHCGGNSFVYKDGEKICIKCGTVAQEQPFSLEPEWRAFDEEERIKKIRVGPPSSYTIPDKGLSTIIDDKRDAHNRSIPLESRIKFRRLKKLQRYTAGNEKSLREGLRVINILTDYLKLPKNANDDASLNYRKAKKENLLKGWRHEIVAAATVYLACRQNSYNRRLEEIAKIISPEEENIRETKKKIGKAYRHLVENLGYNSPPPSKPEYWASIILNKLQMNKIEKEVNEVLKDAEKAKLTAGKNPSNMAAAAIYYVLKQRGEKIKQGEIAEVAGCTEVTLRHRYKELEEGLFVNCYDR